ncbi:MAG: 30S ribosomal protein S8 [Chloroflexi bacterium]|nr:30S ribosomal protein S8 [Chloroflexota bacterium]
MSVTDPIADMLTRIRNAVMVKKDTVLVPSSRLKRAIADVLVDEGYIGRSELVEGEGFPVMRLYLKYDGGKDKEPVLRGLDRVSSPGRRVYARRDQIPWVRAGMGTVILSTSRGVMSGKQARRLGVGGEVLCRIW